MNKSPGNRLNPKFMSTSAPVRPDGRKPLHAATHHFHQYYIGIQVGRYAPRNFHNTYPPTTTKLLPLCFVLNLTSLSYSKTLSYHSSHIHKRTCNDMNRRVCIPTYSQSKRAISDRHESIYHLVSCPSVRPHFQLFTLLRNAFSAKIP